MKENKVVVTGFGTLTALGKNTDEMWENLINGKHGFSAIESVDVTEFSTNLGAEVKEYSIVHKNRITDFVISALTEAINKSQLKQKEYSLVPIIMGTSCGSQQEIEEVNKMKLNEEKSFDDKNYYPDMSDENFLRYVADHFNIKGNTQIVSAACSAGNHSLALGYDLIKSGEEDIVIVGGVDIMSRALMTVFHVLRSLSKNLCKPFDLERDGILVGEGAGIIILENSENAKKRNAPIYGEMIGYGLACDTDSLTAPDSSGRGLKSAYNQLFNTANINSIDVDYISAHGTGTILNDKYEVQALKDIFNPTSDIVINSVKSMFGHTMGAASIIEAISCIKSINTGIVPPTANTTKLDPECDYNIVLNEKLERKIRVATSNAFAFGGALSVVGFKGVEL